MDSSSSPRRTGVVLRLEQPKQRAQGLRVLLVAQDRVTDDIVETLRRRAAGQVVHQRHGYIGQSLVAGLFAEVGVEHGGRDWALAAHRAGEMLGPKPAARANLQDRLARQHVEALAHGDGAPAEFGRRRLRIAQPVGFARPLHFAQDFIHERPQEPSDGSRAVQLRAGGNPAQVLPLCRANAHVIRMFPAQIAGADRSSGGRSHYRPSDLGPNFDHPGARTGAGAL